MIKRHRKIRNRRNHKHHGKLLFFSLITLLFVLAVGYSAFTSNVSVNVTGKVKNCYAACQLKRNVVTTGDGLYSDEYTNGRYVYRGADPNNYLTFNGIDAGFRIIAFEPDGEIKIISKDSIGSMAFDSAGHRSYENNTFCNNIENLGCGVYASVIGNFVSRDTSGTVTEDSEIKQYLNTNYYNSIDTDKTYMINHDFNIGVVFHATAGVYNIISEENDFIWNGLIGLPNTSDYYNASNSVDCRNASGNSSWANQNICTANNNYFFNFSGNWLINGQYVASYPRNAIISGLGTFIGNSASFAIVPTRPVFYLKNDIKLTGNGTIQNPYEIKKE